MTPEGNVKYDKPVIVLANRLTYSAANLFVAMCKSIPNIKLVGDFSGGDIAQYTIEGEIAQCRIERECGGFFFPFCMHVCL